MKKRLISILTILCITTFTAIVCVMASEKKETEAPTAQPVAQNAVNGEQLAMTPKEIADAGLIMYIGNNSSYKAQQKVSIDPDNKNVTPYLKNGRTFIPVRFAAEAFGGTVEWDGKTQTAVLKTNKRNVTITVGKKEISCELVSENNAVPDAQIQTITMDVSAEMTLGRIYVPLRYLADALETEVFYDRGLVIIGKGASSLEATKDREWIDSFISDFTGIKKLGSKEKMIELLGYDPTETMVSIDFEPYSRDKELQFAPKANIPALSESAEWFFAADSVAAPEDFSQTNNQIQGVDEADIIKTDGEYIYYARRGQITIIKANENGDPEEMSNIILDSGLNASEIFIDQNKVIIIGMYSKDYEQQIEPYYYQYDNYTKAVVYDTTDKQTPKLDREVEIKGNYLSARKIGDSIYFVANNNIYGGNILPAYRDSANLDKEIVIGYNDICYLPVAVRESFTSIVGFNIDKPDEDAHIETIFGCGENIYMSENNLYIAGINYQANSAETNIYKYAISNGDIVFASSGSVPGTILNQFSMDEHNGYFRIATNAYGDSGKGYQEYNNLYILDSSLNNAGSVEKIAPGERIYSVRFMGDRAYMVTFKTVDPLFCIDLSDPTDPKVLGTLKIPGYSDYLHPYDENHLIGFGKDTTTDQYGNAFYLGMKLSLFDVTDINDPKEMFVEIIGDRGTESALLRDHKALLFSKEKELLAFPVTVYKVPEQTKKSSPLAYGDFDFAGAYVYHISLDKGFQLKGTISHLTDDDKLKSSLYGGDYEKYIERLLYIKETLYSASPWRLQAHDLNTLEKKGDLKFSNTPQ